jgi:hypothetical protein
MRRNSHSWFIVAVGLMAPCVATEAFGQTATVQLNGGFRPDPGTLRGMSGGQVPSDQLGPACAGYFPARPQHRIQTTGLAALRMFTMAQDNADVTLALVGNGQVFCNDDGAGAMQARLDLPLGAGTYDVYVGSYAPTASYPYTIVFATDVTMTAATFIERLRSTPSPDAGVTVATPDASVPVTTTTTATTATTATGRPQQRPVDQAAFLPPTGANLRLRDGSRPQRLRGRTGGTIAVASLHPGCAGYTFQAPTHMVTIDRGGSPLRFNVTSAADTTLLVRAPDGQVICHDDIAYPTDRNPEVLFPQAVAGSYAVWVGIFSSGSRNLYQLMVSSGSK